VAEAVVIFVGGRVVDSVEVLVEGCVAEVAQGDGEQDVVVVVVVVEGEAERKRKLRIRKTWRISYCHL
jgi:hypothetical protein